MVRNMDQIISVKNKRTTMFWIQLLQSRRKMIELNNKKNHWRTEFLYHFRIILVGFLLIFIYPNNVRCKKWKILNKKDQIFQVSPIVSLWSVLIMSAIYHVLIFLSYGCSIIFGSRLLGSAHWTIECL